MENSGNFKGPGAIPPRWLNCPRKSASLVAGKFLAFKTPLSHRFDDQVPLANQFSPEMLFSSMKSYKVNVGLWIDLTNTSRFYDRHEIENHDARYVKIHCRGHGECPSEQQVSIFVDICDRFIKKNPLEIIAVHCTHGFNRSGFMITSYLIQKEDWSCDLALAEFARARPPGIYKADYVQTLYQRYDDEEAAPSAPTLPDWCLEEEGMDDDDDEDGRSEQTGRKKREIRKSAPVFMQGVPGVLPVLDQPRLSTLQKRIQDMCSWKKRGFPGCQPISMTPENLTMLGERPYRVSWKADGTRYMLLIDGRNQVFFADRDHSIFHAPNVEFRLKTDLKAHLVDTLLDGEMVIDTDPRTQHKYPRYLIYDAVRIQGKNIMQDNFHMRFERVLTDVISPRNAAIEHGLINKAIEPFGVRRKDFWETSLHTVSKLLSSNFKNQLCHEPDGLIFQPEMEPYIPGRCDSVLKWKPETHNSVDFRIKIIRKTGEGMLPTTIGELYVGGLDVPFATMKAGKIKHLNNKVVECKFVNGEWVFMRERTDKSFPNGFTTATAVCSSISNPVTEQMLINFVQTKAFKKSDRELMPPPPKRLKS